MMSFVVFWLLWLRHDGVLPLFGMPDQLVVVCQGDLVAIAAQLRLHCLVGGGGHNLLLNLSRAFVEVCYHQHGIGIGQCGGCGIDVADGVARQGVLRLVVVFDDLI